MDLGAETPRHLDLDLGHPDLPLAGVVREAHVRVGHEAQHGLLVPDEAPVQVVRVGPGDPPAPSLRARRDFGQLPGALCQDGPVPPPHGAAFRFGQGLGGTPADPVARPAQQRSHQARPAVVVGADGEGEFAEQDAFVARDGADLLDGLPAAPAVQALQRQGPVGEDVEPLCPSVDPETGLVGVQRRA